MGKNYKRGFTMHFYRILSGLLVLVLVASATAQPRPGSRGSQGKGTKGADSESKVPTEVGGRSFEDWRRDLTNRDPGVREEAIIAIAQFGAAKESSLVVRLLLGRCADRDHSPRVRAIQALAQIQIPDSEMPRVVFTLAKILTTHSQVVVRYNAGITLTRYSEHCKSVQKMIITATTERPGSSWRVRQVALMVLGVVGRTEDKPSDPEAMKAAVRALSDSTLAVRVEAIKAINYMGKTSDPQLQMQAEAGLRSFTGGKNKVAAIWAWIALMSVTDVNTEAVEAIGLHLQHEEARIRIAACGALGMLGERAKFAIPKLIKVLEDKDPSVAASAMSTLANMKTPGIAAINALTDFTNAKDGKKYSALKDDKIREALQKKSKAALEFIRNGGKKPEMKKKP